MSISAVSASTISGGMTQTITQAAHGFTVGQVVQMNAGTWALALANDATTLGVGVVLTVIDANNFKVCYGGEITGLAALTPGEYYYVSADTPGLLTNVEPIVGFSNPLFLATSATAGMILPYRPSGLGVASLSYLTGRVNTNAYSTDIGGPANHIKFDAVMAQTGTDISLDTTNGYTSATNVDSVGRITLQANKVYELTHQLYVSGSTGYMYYGWYNADTGAPLDQGHFITVDNAASTNSSTPSKSTIFAPTVNTRVELRILQNSGITNVYGPIGPSGGTAFSVKTIAAVIPTATPVRNEVRVDTYNGYGSTGTCIRRFTNAHVNTGSAITYVQDAVNGDSFVITESGYYAATHTFDMAIAGRGGISVNVDAVGMTTNIANIAVAKRLALAVAQAGQEGTVSWTGYLQAGDVIRPHSDGNTTTVASRNFFSICKLS